ncbi:hypothetical protein ACFLWW_02585 [Chloroflexota bacterium]
MNFDLLLKYLPLVLAVIALIGLLIEWLKFRNENSKRKKEIEAIRINISTLNSVSIGTMIKNINISPDVLAIEQLREQFKHTKEEDINGR